MNIHEKLYLSRRPGIISAFIENGVIRFYNHSLARWLTISDPINIYLRKNKRNGIYYFG